MNDDEVKKLTDLTQKNDESGLNSKSNQDANQKPVLSQDANEDTNTTSVSIPSEAEDSDLIEKEWVERAKEIVEHTKNDPHEQQKALGLMKADYMKKRYNRDIKVSEQDLKPDSGE